MSVLFRAALGFLLAFAAMEPHAFAAYFETPAVQSLKAQLTDAERDQASRFDARQAAPLDAAIAATANILRSVARAKNERF